MDTQPVSGGAESPKQVETQPSILEILAGGFNEVSDDAPLFV